MNTSRAVRFLGLGALALIAACADDPGAPDPIPTDQLTFLRLAADAPALASTSESFWAVRGQDREVEIEFVAPVGAQDTFLEFRVRPASLASYPDGSPFVGDDSVFITVTVEDTDPLIVRFAPSGLRFSSVEPARLDLYYRHADPDYDLSGTVDDDDLLIESTLMAIWKQEVPGGPWVRIGGIRDIELDEIEANIHSFTGYAIAFRR